MALALQIIMIRWRKECGLSASRDVRNVAFPPPFFFFFFFFSFSFFFFFFFPPQQGCSAAAPMRLALLQINPTAGDLDGNSSLIVRAARAAQAQGADLMVTPELALMGYLPRDLLMNQGFMRRGWRETVAHCQGTEGRAAVAGGRGDAESVGRGAPLVQQRGAAAGRRGGAGLSQIALADLRCLR